MMLPRHALDPARGAALVVALLMLTVVLLLGIAAAQLAMMESQAARQDRDRQMAFQAAEAALADAQMDLESGQRQQVFASNGKVGFEEGCSANGDYLGLCKGSTSSDKPVWLTVDFTEDGPTVPYGKFTGRTYVHGSSLLPALAPRYIIEALPYIRPGQELDSTIYRITAMGFGSKPTTKVVLQSVYRRKSGDNSGGGGDGSSDGGDDGSDGGDDGSDGDDDDE